MTLSPDPNFDLSPAWAVLPWAAAAVALVALARRRAGPAQARAGHWSLWAFRAAALALLAAVVANPVRVSITPAPLHRPEVHVLLDSSQGMKLGSPESRWQEATALLRAALEKQGGHADVRAYRFGDRLVAVDPAGVRSGELAPPTDAGARLGPALRQLGGRLGRDAPAAVVVASSGRVRDADQVGEMAAPWKRAGVPVHVVPVGRAAEGGDVAVVAAVAPAKARKQARVAVDVFLRSFGFAGQRAELHLQALADNGTVRRTLTKLPVTLRDGVQPLTVAFRMEPDIKKLRLHLPAPPGDLTPSNNDFPLEIELDRTKIRVLLLDGSEAAGIPTRPDANRPFGEFDDDSDAPYAPLRDALAADPDVQCTVYHVTAGGEPRRVLTRETAHLGSAFPKTAAELLAYDALILSNVPREALSEGVAGWVEEWIGKRGGGLLMAGGPRAFGAGGWADTPVARMLPVEVGGAADWEASPVAAEPTGADLHPIWRLFEDERATRAALKALPESVGRNGWSRVKPQTGTVLGTQKGGALPLLAVGGYGRGRTAALAAPLTAAWSPQFTRAWGEAGDNRYFAKFARNLVYWLTEESQVGRRRLVAGTDKRYYRPGETVALSAHTFDESATRTGRYRVVALLEPKSLDGPDLPPGVVRWPVGRPRVPGESGPLVGWGEEVELVLDPVTKEHTLPLPLVEALANGASGQAFKLELTAYEGLTQIDSSSLDVQVLSEPPNPLPDRDFLSRLAAATGGRELPDAAALAEALKGLPVVGGPETVTRTPLWSREWLLGLLIGVLSLEWFVRRWLGLA
jgi:uncharacterized membrane protein